MPKAKEKPLTREDVLRLIEENGGTAEGLDLSDKFFEDGVDLSGLDLKGIIIKEATLVGANLKEVFLADTHCQGAYLMDAHLEGADLRNARLEEAELWQAHLERADLRSAHLEGAFLRGAQLEGAYLTSAHLEGTLLESAHLEKANLRNTHLEKANLRNTHLEGANLRNTHLEEADLLYAHLEGAHLEGANLEGAKLWGADLEEAHLAGANLKRANLSFTYLERAFLRGARLEGAYLYRARFSSDTRLEDVDWGNYVLGEEKSGSFDWAVATYRQLKVWYAQSGYSDIAAKFYYREKEANRKALKWRSKNWRHRLALELSRALFGYGEHWERILVWMAVVVFGLAIAYRFGGLSLSYSLYFSAISFTALGYGNWLEMTNDWIRGLGAFESFIGVFSIALFLVTFIRKMTR